jgi:hypothetical protein
MEEANRRGRDVVLGVRVVVPAWREADADHVDRRVDRLERIVGPREQRLVGGAGGAAPGRVELRLPEARLVRLVADDVVLDERIGRREFLEKRRELPDP